MLQDTEDKRKEKRKQKVCTLALCSWLFLLFFPGSGLLAYMVNFGYGINNNPNFTEVIMVIFIQLKLLVFIQIPLT